MIATQNVTSTRQDLRTENLFDRPHLCRQFEIVQSQDHDVTPNDHRVTPPQGTPQDRSLTTRRNHLRSICQAPCGARGGGLPLIFVRFLGGAAKALKITLPILAITLTKKQTKRQVKTTKALIIIIITLLSYYDTIMIPATGVNAKTSPSKPLWLSTKKCHTF